MRPPRSLQGRRQGAGSSFDLATLSCGVLRWRKKGEDKRRRLSGSSPSSSSVCASLFARRVATGVRGGSGGRRGRSSATARSAAPPRPPSSRTSPPTRRSSPARKGALAGRGRPVLAVPVRAAAAVEGEGERTSGCGRRRRSCGNGCALISLSLHPFCSAETSSCFLQAQHLTTPCVKTDTPAGAPGGRGLREEVGVHFLIGLVRGHGRAERADVRGYAALSGRE